MNTTALIIDVLVLLALVFFAWRGKVKGFVLTLCSFLAVFVALFGANYLATRFEPAAIDYLQPRIEAALTERFQQELEQEQQQNPEITFEQLPLEGIVGELISENGLLESFLSGIEQSINSVVEQTVTQVAKSLSEYLAQVVARNGLFLFFFIVIMLLWTLLSRVLDLACRLPVLRSFNEGAGLLVGLCKGALIVWLVIGVLRIFTGFFDNDMISSSFLLRFFTSVQFSGIFSS